MAANDLRACHAASTGNSSRLPMGATFVVDWLQKRCTEKVHLDVDYQSYVRVTFLAQPTFD